MTVTLRLIIGSLCALAVLAVAASTLAVSNLFAQSAIEEIASRFSTALLVAARGKTATLLSQPVSMLVALDKEMQMNGSYVPTDLLASPAMDAGTLCTAFRTSLITSNYNFTSLDLFYRPYETSTAISIFRAMPFTSNDQAACVLKKSTDTVPSSTTDVQYFYISTLARVAPANELTIAQQITVAQRDRDLAKFQRMNDLLLIDPSAATHAAGSKPRWLFFEPYSRGASISTLNLVLGTRSYNRSGDFLGVLTFHVDVEPINAALQTLDRTPNSVVFILLNSSIILASTQSKAIRETRSLQDTSSLTTTPSAGCYSALDTADNSKSRVICTETVATYGYGPLKTLAASNPEFLAPTQTITVTKTIDGTEYFLGADKVPTAAPGLSVSVVFFLPKEDVTKDVTDGTLLIVGVAVGVLVLATCVSVFAIFKILQPLEVVSNRMNSASTLGGEEDDELTKLGDPSDSAIAEVAALSTSFAGMTVAIASFSSYLPQTILKDQATNGTLCKLGMQPAIISALASDILGFTNICENTDPERLSFALNAYFASLTAQVAFCGGVCETYVGDAIQAVWNAPCVTVSHELKATLCALLMQRELSMPELTKEWDAIGEKCITRIGVSTGEVLTGNFGSRQRMSWTCIGRNFSLAGDLEAFNKNVGTRVNISGDVELKIRNVMCCRLIGPVKFGGTANEADGIVTVYAPHGLLPSIDLNLVLNQKDEESLSQSLSQMSQSLHSSGGKASTAARRLNVSRRAGARISTKQLVQAAQSFDRHSIVVTEAEHIFCQKLSRCVAVFESGDLHGCLSLLNDLKSSDPEFFGDDEAALRSKVGGDKRCDGLLVRAGKSAAVLVKTCEALLKTPDIDPVNYVLQMKGGGH